MEYPNFTEALKRIPTQEAREYRGEYDLTKLKTAIVVEYIR